MQPLWSRTELIPTKRLKIEISTDPSKIPPRWCPQDLAANVLDEHVTCRQRQRRVLWFRLSGYKIVRVEQRHAFLRDRRHGSVRGSPRRHTANPGILHQQSKFFCVDTEAYRRLVRDSLFDCLASGTEPGSSAISYSNEKYLKVEILLVRNRKTPVV